jgi:exonuclease III
MPEMYQKQNLTLSTWNINGYISKGYNKFQDQEFEDCINNLVDIFCLQETHCDLDQCLQLDDFSRPVHLIRPKLKQIGKRSGGLSVYIRNNIRLGVKFLEHETNDSIWVKLCIRSSLVYRKIYLDVFPDIRSS